MARLKFAGPVLYRIRSFAKISQISMMTALRHAFGRRMAPDWDVSFETGIRFVRHQFTKAMTLGDMTKGRLLFDSLQPETDTIYDIQTQQSEGIKGLWHRPTNPTSTAVLLYLHGGGYSFHAGVSQRYAAMLAHHTGAALFAPDYRLTPEHPHPAQEQDAMAAWTHLTQTVPPERIVVIGDSAGGHMALMLLQTLKHLGKPQPALCIGLCPWTDIGDRGESLKSNDAYDLVQGWMALQFGKWLDPKGQYGREKLSPIAQDYTGLAPLYLQAGGREVLRDMIVDFAQVQKNKGAGIILDLWPDMPHNFQAYDSLKTSSSQALVRISERIEDAMSLADTFPALTGITIVEG